MCDCFHLAFPNWHAPAAGAGRRLTGPEQDVEEDSVCAEPEILESERPRPQGSSPIEEFPIEKQAEDDISDLAQKSGSNKKSRKTGFGALFDKRTSDKMNEAEDMQSGESEIIVKTLKEACVEGLVMTGGGKGGIFIKEVKVDSPASKHLSVKEGDQILSATVYFDNVSYEDALKILEHAQPYKMEFCLRRQVEPTIPENAEIMRPKEKDQGSPTMRSQRKIKKQQERISWPKFPSFGKGPRVQFKRSHSTSEAEEHRKLEMSPPTSDTESPLKSPLKFADGKDKKKKHKVHLKVKMKGHRSKSVEEAQSNEKELVCDNQQVGDILEEKIPEGHEEKMLEISQVLDRSENKVSPKTVNDNAFQSVSVMELHEAHLISLGNTLKTTDISVALAEEGKIESSELKVRFPQIKKPNVGTESHAETIKALYTTSDTSACDNVVLSQTGVEISQLDNDISKEDIGKGSSEKQMEYGNADSKRVGNEKQRKEKSVFENESYGIRTRGPLADMATSKAHFVSTVNGLQFMSPKMSDEHAVDKDIPLVKTSKLPTQTNDFILADLAKRTESEFKVPKVDHFKFATHELIKKTEVEQIRTHLPKREYIEIPGMENKETKPSLQTPEIKVPKIKKIINITKERVIQDPQTDEEFNVEDVKVAVSKFPAFKLPEGDITGVLVQREIEMKSDKSTLTPRGSPHKISITSTDSGTIMPKTKVGEEMSLASDAVDKDRGIKIPEVELTYIDEQTSTAVIKIAYTPPQKTDYGRFGDLNFKLPKREDIEIPGMEAIKESNLLCTADLDQAEKPKTKKHGDKKCHEKKSKKSKITVEGYESPKPDTQSPDFSTELPKKYSSKIDTGEPKIHEKQKFKTPNIGEFENIDVQIQESKIIEDNMDLPQKTETKFVNKLKIPSTTLPEFGTKVPVEEVDISAVDVNVKVAGKKLPENKMKLSDEPSLTYLDGTDANKDGLSDSGYGRAQDTETEGQGRKFKLPKFELSFPEVKAPRIICTSKKDDDSSVSEESGKVPVVHSPKAEPSTVEHEVSGDLPDTGTEITEVKIKRPGFSFPRFGISKSEHAPLAANVPSVDMSLPEGHTQMDNLNTSVKDGKQKDATKFASPTKFKIPSIKFPNFGVKAKATMETSDVAVDIKGPDISLPHTEPILVDIKEPDVDKQKKSVSTEFINMEIQIEAKGSNFKAESDISVPKAKVEMHPPDVEMQGVSAEMKADLPEVDSKGLELKMKMPGFSFPKIELSKSEVKPPKGDGSLQNIDVSFPEESTEFETPSTDLNLSMEDAEQKDPIKFKLPSVSFPKFGTKSLKASVELPDVDVDVKGPEINLPEAELKLTAEPLSVDIKGLDADKELKLLSVEMKDQDIQMKEQGSKFKLPKFGIILPEVKGPKLDISSEKAEIDISIPKAKVEMHPPDVKVQVVTAEIKADLPEKDSKGLDLKMKTPGFSFPKIELSKSEVKAPEADVGLPNVDLSLFEGSMEIDQPTTDVTIPDVEQKGRSKFGSPTKFKLPSINFPKFGTKGRKASVELPDVDVEVKGPEINLPAEIKLSAEPLSVDIHVKGLDADKELKPLSVEMKDQDIQMKEQGSKFKLPKFGISLPEVKGPKTDISLEKAEIDISVPKAKVEMHPPDVEVQGITAEIKADLPEVDSKGLELKMKTPGFSFPKIELSRSEVKAPEGDVSLPNVDVSLPEGSMEIDQPTTDVTIPDVEKKGRSMFGSPTKFKLPSINFPKFGTKGPKASVELPDVDVEVKGPEINLPEAEMKLSAEPLSIDIKGPDAGKELEPFSVEMKDQDIQMKEQGSKFKLPKFGISLPEVKGPKIDISSEKAEIDISVQKAKVEMHPPDVEVQGVTAEIKADLPEVDSKGLEMKMKTPGFSFPKIELSRSEVKAPEGDVSLPNVDVSLPEGSMEIDQRTTDVTIPDVEKKGRSMFGSPTKFKLPSINFPKFGTKGPKASVELRDVDVEVKGPEINLPEAEMKLTAEPLSIDIKGPDADKELKPLSVEVKDQDIQMKEQGIKFKLPKFEFSLPEIKGPKLYGTSDKADIDIAVPKAQVEVHPPNVEVQGVTAEMIADLPEVDSKYTEVKMKTPVFSFPGIGFGNPEVKLPEDNASLPNVDVSLPEGSMEIDQPTADVTIPDVEQKGQSKFGYPTKFKLPSISFPKFGTKGPKASVEVSDVDVIKPARRLLHAEIILSAEPLSVNIKGPELDNEIKSVSLEIKDQDIKTKEQGSKFKLPKFGISLSELKGPKFDVTSDKADIDISVPKAQVEVYPPNVEVEGVTAEVKAHLPEVDSKDIGVKCIKSDSITNNEVAKAELDSQEGKCGNEDTAVNNNALDVILEPTQKYTEGVKMSSKFILPTLDVFSGFEVDFNVPTFDDIEETKKKNSDPLKHEHNIAVRGRLSTEGVSKHEYGGTLEKSATDQNKDGGQKQTHSENSDWFRFPKLPSPSKDNEKITFQLQNKTEHSPQTDIESRKSFTRDTRDIDEDNVSPTLSLSSSDAFADVSSALTSEQIGLLLTSPTKVKVKYSEPTANAEVHVSDVHGDIITSTARTEIISMEPHQPEKVNISFSSETSSSSVDTLKQMSGHIVVSNVQNVSKTEHATILTKVDTQTLPPEKATDSMFSVEETIMRTGHTIVEKHVVKEIFGDDNEKIFVTQRIQVYEGDSTEPISDDIASSIQKLKDSVHTEKIRFFEEAESSQTILMATETLLRHADSSTDENGGK
ncbi:neuroblast differentiation-associated protein AHNAK-like [Tachysurus ichikawai]